MEQDAHIEGALAAEASLVVLDTLETVVQADGGGGKQGTQVLFKISDTYKTLKLCRCSCRSSVESTFKGIGQKSKYICTATHVQYATCFGVQVPQCSV